MQFALLSMVLEPVQAGLTFLLTLYLTPRYKNSIEYKN